MPLVAAHPGQQQAPQSSRQRERGEGGNGGRGVLVEGGELVKGGTGLMVEGGELVKMGSGLLVEGGELVKGGRGGNDAFPLKISTTSNTGPKDEPAAQTNQIFKSAHESTHNRFSKPITIFNTCTFSTTHLYHPQTVPVPEMAATLR